MTNAQRNKGARGISTKQMVSMGKWLEANKQIESLKENIKKIRKQIERDIIKKSDVIFFICFPFKLFIG